MSRQLTLSALICALAMTATAVIAAQDRPASDAGVRPATAHGSILSVLLRA